MNNTELERLFKNFDAVWKRVTESINGAASAASSPKSALPGPAQKKRSQNMPCQNKPSQNKPCRNNPGQNNRRGRR